MPMTSKQTGTRTRPSTLTHDRPIKPEFDVNRPPSAFSVRFLAAASLFAGSALAPLAAEPGAPVPLAAHHATYKLALLKATGANAPAAASGYIDYDFRGSGCTGFKTVFRQVTNLQPDEGDSRLNDMTSTTFEDGAAKRFTFTTKTSNDGKLVTDLEGEANRNPDGSLAVKVKRPADSVSFGQDILFPTQHLEHIIATAEAGGKILTASVYDGSDTGKKLFRTLTVIGAPITAPPADAAGKTEALATMRRWPIAVSYFESEDADKPDYVLSFDLYENGISRALKLDYGDFVLSGEMTALSVADTPACPKP